jgi:hypothetical protein
MINIQDGNFAILHSIFSYLFKVFQALILLFLCINFSNNDYWSNILLLYVRLLRNIMIKKIKNFVKDVISFGHFRAKIGLLRRFEKICVQLLEWMFITHKENI